MAMQVADLEAVLKLNDKEYLKSMNISEKEAKKMISEIQKAHERAEKENIRLAKETERFRIKSAKESAQVFIQEEKRKEKEVLRVEKEQQILAKETARIKEKEARKTQQEQEKLNKKNIAEQQAMYDKLKSIARTAFTAISIVGTTAMVGIAKNSIEYTSDLKELENVLSVTFGDRFNAIALNADAMGRAMGRSSLQMRGAVAQAGALGKGLGFVGDDLENMSLNLAKTAVDMGSFFNVADDEAFTALRAGLTGETEPMKRFGIVMTENNLKAYALQSGVKKLWKEMSEAEKTQVRYNYMLEKTSFFAGDAARTINSTANQTKVMQANLGRLYQTIGKEIEPVWNEFLQNLNKTIESFAENEEKGHGFATSIKEIAKAIQTLAVPIEWIIKLMQRLGEMNNQSVEKMSFDKQYNDIIYNNKEFLKKNKEFFDEKKKQHEEAFKKEQESTIAYNREQIKAYETTDEYKLAVIKKFNEDKETLNNYEKAKTLEIYGQMTEQSKQLFADLINASGKAKNEIGQNLIDTLEFYVKFTKGMSAEIKKQVSVTAALGSARSAVEQGKSLKEAGNIATQTYNLTMKTLGLDTGNQDNLIKDIRNQYGYKPFKVSEFDKSWIENINNSPVEEKDKKELTLSELQSQYEAEIKAFNEYAKQRQLSEEEKLQGLLNIQDSYAKQAIDNKWTEYGKTLSIQANETQNKIKNIEEEKKSLDELNKSYEEAPEKIQAKIQAEKDYYLKQQEMQDDVFKTLSEATNKKELKTAMETLFGKYSDQIEVIKYLNNLYPEFIKNLKNQKITVNEVSNVFSETSKIASELATLFEDDLLGGISSLIGAGGNLATNLMNGNVLGSVSSGLALVNQLDSFLNDDGASKQQEEANTKFQEAVESFKKSVEDFSLGQKISFAKLEKPSNLVGAITGTGEKGTQLWESMFTGGAASVIDMLKGNFKASNASLDTTALQQQLASAGYGGIDVNAIFGKYAQRDSYRNWYGKKESYISGYDTAGAMAEITKLIEEAWQANLEGFAQALSLSSQDFISNMVDVFKSGGSISESVNDMFYNAVIEAFFNQELFETLNKNLSGAISEIIIGQMTTEGLDLGIDFSGITPEEMIASYTEIYGSASEKLTAILEGLGIAASSATDQLNQVSTKNLPSGLKVATTEFQASNASYGQTYQTIYRIENNYSKDFSEMVATSQNQSRFNQTGNARRGY